MTDHAALEALLARVREATGPDRELDNAIWEALCWSEHWRDIPAGTPFTAIIDTALALVEKVKPGAFWIVAKGKTHAAEPPYGCQLLFGTDEVLGQDEAPTAPLAILAALITTKIADAKP